MANGINKVVLIGNIGNIETKNNITKASLATSESYSDKNTGKKVESTQWHRLTFFGKIAEIADKYVKKGDLIYVDGSIRYGKYTDHKGVERHTVDIVVRNMQMLGGKKSKEDRPPHPAVDQNNYDRRSEEYLDDIPF